MAVEYKKVLVETKDGTNIVVVVSTDSLMSNNFGHWQYIGMSCW